MKKIGVLYILLFTAQLGFGQCSFDPIITTGDVLLCPGSSDTLFSSPATSYLWYKNGNPLIGQTQNFLVVNQAQDAGSTFLVVATIAGCSEASPAITVTNQPIPPLAITVVDDLSPEACDGEFRSLTINDPFNTNIRWFRNGVQLSGQVNDTLFANQSGNYSAIAFTDVCPSYSQTSAIVSVSYATLVTPIILFNSGDLSLSTTTPGQSYQWYIDGNPVAGAVTSTFLPQQNGSVVVEVAQNAGCVGSSAPYDYTQFVANCQHDPLITPNDLILCPQTTDTLFTQSGDAYQWYQDGLLIPGANDSFLIVSTFESSGSYFSVETTLDGCAEISPEVLVDGYVFLPISVQTDGGGALVYCQGDTLTLSVGLPFNQNISWFKDGILLDNESSVSLEIYETGSYQVSAATEICPLYEETSFSLDYTFLLNPQPVLTYYPFSNTIGADVLAATYTWYVDDVIIPGASTQLITPTESGLYHVEVEYESSCINTSEPIDVQLVGIEDLQSPEFRVFPNPSKQLVTLSVVENGCLYVFDSFGRCIEAIYLNKGANTLSVEAWESGIYLLSFESTQSRKGLKFQKLD